jgi:arsenate reductase-like glutaredoxin family protein
LRDKTTIELTAVDYSKKTQSLDEATVLGLVEKAGSVAAVLNTRHATAKDKGWVTTPPTAAAFAKAVVAEPNLLRRPILVLDDGRIVVGFDKAAYGKLR